jgi:hypothetical protein
VGLEWGPLSLVSTIEELLGRNSSGSDLENWVYGSGDLLHWPRNALYPKKLARTSPRSGHRSVGIVRLRTKATEFFFLTLWSVKFLWNLKMLSTPHKILCYYKDQLVTGVYVSNCSLFWRSYKTYSV